MATVPIVTEVTKAQLDALVAANGLNEGLQYKVTDKNWLLIATGVNTLKCELLEVNYPDALPAYVEAQFILLKSGLIPNNVSTFNFTEFAADYMFMYADFIFLSDTTMTAYLSNNGIQMTDNVGGVAGDKQRAYIHTENPDFIAVATGDIALIITDNNTGGMKCAVMLSRFLI